MKLPFLSRPPKEAARRTQGSVLKVGESDPIYSEQIKAMRAKVEYMLDMMKIRTIAVTSAISGEGKTTLCAKLGANLASAGRKQVLLVDTDLRKADLGRGLGIPHSPGLSEFILEAAPLDGVLHKSVAPGVDFIPSGTEVSSPGDLLSGTRFREFLADIRNRYDVVILDTPPVLPVADTLSLRDQVDGFVFVYRASFTPHDMFRQAVDEIGEKKVVGAVINGVDPERQRYYERYYGKYYTKQSDPSRYSQPDAETTL
jgi:tyrosine-protein kinase Etk/Wzc